MFIFTQILKPYLFEFIQFYLMSESMNKPYPVTCKFYLHFYFKFENLKIFLFRFGNNLLQKMINTNSILKLRKYYNNARDNIEGEYSHLNRKIMNLLMSHF